MSPTFHYPAADTDAVQDTSAAPAAYRQAAARPGPRGLFITGTDTDVGKTEVTLALMNALAGRGERVLGMKPVASGGHALGGALRCDDALRLLAAGAVPVPYKLINPYAFGPPIAPHVAAGMIGTVIELATIRDAYRRLAGQADWVLVEGVGGWRVPLGPSLAVSDLPAALDLPVILVVGLRLGCLNHSLLTVESIRARGAQLAGWVANTRDPDMLARDETIATLAALIDAPNLGVLPWLSPPTPAALAAHLHLDGL